MRNVVKGEPPEILVANKRHWDDSLSENPSEHNRTKYRHPEIKAALLEETNHKCVYCESKLGHNCPGDIEHKAPKSKCPHLIFDWNNMTIACTECNRRKLDYYEPSCMFLDPNSDDVEGLIFHCGPLVFSVPGNGRAEATVAILHLNRLDQRRELIARKIELIESAKHLVERIVNTSNKVVRTVLLEHLDDMCDSAAEFSGMVVAYCAEVKRRLPAQA